MALRGYILCKESFDFRAELIHENRNMQETSYARERMVC